MFDFSAAVNYEGLTVYPDFPFGTLPKDPDDVGESVVIRGSNASASQQFYGTADQTEN
jgi:hypothetical protein